MSREPKKTTSMKSMSRGTSFTSAAPSSSMSRASSSGSTSTPPSFDIVSPTFRSPNADAHLGLLMTLRKQDPCLTAADAEAYTICSGALLAYKDIILTKNRKDNCPGATEAECREIEVPGKGVQRRCTVWVSRSFLAACLTCSPQYMKLLDQCVQELEPPLALMSSLYSFRGSRGIGSSQGGTPAKPTYTPPED